MSLLLLGSGLLKKNRHKYMNLIVHKRKSVVCCFMVRNSSENSNELYKKRKKEKILYF